jgi:NifU-like protein involved in Fe-S cluster formation
VDFAIDAVCAAVSRLRALSAASPAPFALTNGTVVVSGEAAGGGQETWVRFHLMIAGDIVREARFQAFGCPHTTDVAAWLCETLPGRTRGALIPGTPADWARARGIPDGKLGRLLVVEDALRACLAHWN